MDRGWIKVYRKIEDNPIWFSEPFTRAQAWIDLIMIANRKPGYFMIRGNRIDVGRGQTGRSVSSLANRWKWSRSKVERFLKDLKKEHQIEHQKSTITTLISITNYNDYQPSEHQDEHQTEQQTSTNKKYSIESIQGFNIFYKNILSLFPEIFRPDNKAKQSAWIDCLDKLVRLDNLLLNDILKITKWAREDEFWTKQFQSVLKLRRNNKDGIPFHIIFMEKYKDNYQPPSSWSKKLGDEQVRR